MKLIDTHCHLDLLPEIDRNAAAIIDQDIITISVTNAPDFFSANQKLFGKFPNVTIALGLHPQLIEKYGNTMDSFANQLNQTALVGEIGLDGSFEYIRTLHQQKTIFEEILKLVVKDTSKLLTVHSRKADRETVDTLHIYLRSSTTKVILHWFSGSNTVLESAIKYGYYFSINHKMFESANGNRIIQKIPLDRILTETDAPFSFDSNVKSQRESLLRTISLLARSHGLTEDQVISKVYQNYKEIMMTLKYPPPPQISRD